MAKRRNPQDATRRNVQATNKKIEALKVRIRRVELAMRAVMKLVVALNRRA